MKASNRNILFLILLQVSLGATGFAQRNLDSLQKILPTLSDTSRIDCLHQICVYYLKKPDHDSALYFAEKVYEASKKINYTHGIAVYFTEMSAYQNHKFHRTGDTLVEMYSRESLRVFGLTGNKKEIEVPYWQLGRELGGLNNYDSAIYYLEQSYNWTEKNRNYEFMLHALGGLYECYRDAGNYDQCFESLQKTQLLNLKMFGKRDSLAEYYMLGELNRRIENYDTALHYYREFVSHINLRKENIWYRISYPELFALANQFDSAKYYYDQIDSSKLNSHEMRFYLMSRGEYYLLKKEYPTAIDFFLKELPMHQEANDQKEIKRTLLDIAKAYDGMGEDGKALVYAREVQALSVQSNAKQFLRDVYEMLYRIFERTHQSDSAFHYYRKYIAQKELVAGDIVKGKLAAYKYDQRIDVLNNLNAVQQAKLEKESFMKKILIGGILGFLILGLVIFRVIVLKRRHEQLRLEQELELEKMESEKTKAELQQQASELEMQALRSQMNPHFIFNCLNSINRFILKNESEAASDYLTKFSRLIRMVLNNSKKTSILLEDELETLRLYLDLERLRFKNSFDYSIVFHNNFDAASVFIPPLLLQPFAENAIWHGLMHKNTQGHLEIAFELDDNTLNCYITDNGVGRVKAQALKSKSSEKQKSMGMQITAGRLELLNRNMEQAFFEIEDLEDEQGNATGTRVTLKIKYTDTHKELSET